jgi:hypothetical protein
MNIKKYLSLVFVLALLIVGVRTVKADDSGQSIYGAKDLWVTPGKILCASVTNPEFSDGFLIYDYSSTTGSHLGRPWTIVEPGKCYEFKFNSFDMPDGMFYKLQSTTGNMANLKSGFENFTSMHSSSEDIQNIMDSQNVSDEMTLGGMKLSKFGTNGFGWISFPYERTNINLDNLIPTTYKFGGGDSTAQGMTPGRKAATSQEFVNANTAYDTLLQQLNSALSFCDNRVRVEYQLSLEHSPNSFPEGINGFKLTNIVSRFSDGRNVVTPPRPGFWTRENSGVQTPQIDFVRWDLSQIETEGCKSAFDTFVLSHKKDFVDFNQKALQFINKYPDIGYIGKRDSASLAEIDSFIGKTMIPVSHNTGVLSTTPTTAIDEPTPEKKTDTLINSSNPLMRVYVWLPLVALIGILGFLAFRKK